MAFPRWRDIPEVRRCQRALYWPDSGMQNFRDKVLTLAGLPAWRVTVRQSSRRLVVTNGCFDLLHLGHVTYLESARNYGELLLIGVNADVSVRALKGPDRPINSEVDRALVLAALQCVDAVCIFPEPRAANFLRLAQPDIYVKGGDYTVATLDQEERQVVEQGGGKIIILPLVPGKSTTGLLKKLHAGT